MATQAESVLKVIKLEYLTVGYLIVIVYFCFFLVFIFLATHNNDNVVYVIWFQVAH